MSQIMSIGLMRFPAWPRDTGSRIRCSRLARSSCSWLAASARENSSSWSPATSPPSRLRYRPARLLQDPHSLRSADRARPSLRFGSDFQLRRNRSQTAALHRSYRDLLRGQHRRSCRCCRQIRQCGAAARAPGHGPRRQRLCAHGRRCFQRAGCGGSRVKNRRGDGMLVGRGVIAAPSEELFRDYI